MGPVNGHRPADRLVQNIAHHEVYAQHSKRRLGNNEGFALLDMYEKVTDDLSEVKKLVTTIREENTVMRERFRVVENEV